MPHSPKFPRTEAVTKVQENKAFKNGFTWSPKAMKFKSETGYVVKTKARLNHECHICGETICTNDEYYKLQYYGNWTKYPICENCWDGKTMSARNKAKYEDTGEFATDSKRMYRW